MVGPLEVPKKFRVGWWHKWLYVKWWRRDGHRVRKVQVLDLDFRWTMMLCCILAPSIQMMLCKIKETDITIFGEE